MRDKKSDLANHLLHGAVRVIEERPFLMHGELIDVFFAWCHGLLADPGNAVLFDGNLQAVPMQRSRFGELVLEDHPDAVALLNLDGWPRSAAVVAPSVDGFERCDFALHGLGNEAKNLYAGV